MPQPSWWLLADAGKEAALTAELLDGTDREAMPIARGIGVSVATATKFLYRLVYAGVVIASPPLHCKRTGSTARTFRLRKTGEEAPDLDTQPADVLNCDEGSAPRRGWSSPIEEAGTVV